jgi:hypothetical protein
VSIDIEKRHIQFADIKVIILGFFVLGIVDDLDFELIELPLECL